MDNWHYRLNWSACFSNFNKVNSGCDLSEHRKTCKLQFILSHESSFLAAIEGSGDQVLSGKTWRKDCKDKERGRVENNCVPEEELLKLKHLSRKETKDRSSITPVWARIPSDLTSRTVSDKRSAKGSAVGRALVIQRVVIFLLQRHWVDTSAKCGERCAFSWSLWGVTARLPWPVQLWPLPTAERFIPGSCPNSNARNNILPNLLAPLIWRGKQSLRLPTEKVCKGQNNACILPDWELLIRQIVTGMGDRYI